jgi:uncharacterized protein YhaN
MKLLSLKVEHFRSIRSAKIQFAEGLNVLHGPNDLGKSTLVHAIRAALLLQTNVKEGEAFVSWHAPGDPHVELVFESEPQRIWRVKKTFGTTSASLEWSRDGVDFSREEPRGRQVDERLREILRWGVAPPGGNRRPKGMPATFLTTALLPEQDHVDAIFEQALAADSDESGKKQLIAALQAMAENPLFKSVLAVVQERVDQAFNVSDDKVIKKRGKNSPWVKLNEEIQDKQRRNQECQRDLQETIAIEEDIRDLRERRLQLKETAARADERKAALCDGLQKLGRRQEIAARLQERRNRLDAIRTELEELQQLERAHAEGARRIGNLTKARTEAQAVRDQAAEVAQQAGDELARQRSEDRVRERQLAQKELEARSAELQSEQLRLDATLAKVHAVEAAASKMETLRGELIAIQASAADLRKRSEAVAGERAEVEKQQNELRAIRSFLQWQAAQEQLRQAERGVAQLNDWRKQAVDKRAAAAALEAAQPHFPLPEREALRRLESDMRVAAAKLAVGLSVTVVAKRAVRVAVQADDGSPTSHELDLFSLEANAYRKLRIDIDKVAEIAVSGGAADARVEMEALEKRWAEEAKPMLQEAGVATIEELVRVAEEASERANAIDAALRDAAQLDQRIADQPDWATMLAQRQQVFHAAEQALMGADPAKLERAARKLRADTASIEQRLETVRGKIEQLAEDARQVDSKVAAENARAAEKQKALDEARGDLEQKQTAIGGNWQEVFHQAQEKQIEIKCELDTLQNGWEELAKAGDRDLAAAQWAVDMAKGALKNAEDAFLRVQEDLTKANLLQAESEGILKTRREAAAKLNEKQAREDFALVEAELRSAPAPEEVVTGEMLAAAEKNCRQAGAQLEEIDGKIREKQGALQQVGGEVARQKAEDAASELALAKERAHQTELEYEAWELLRKTLREAEQEEGTNLGRALADPVTERFAALAGGHYGKLALGPNLQTEGISVAGENRLVHLLSVGTRDQLSTIFRLTLAEQLRTAVILDDQLTHTDGKRMLWLRGLLNEIARTIQVIVLTCRPGDYIVPAGGRGRAKRQEEAAPVHAVALEQAIERSIGASAS